MLTRKEGHINNMEFVRHLKKFSELVPIPFYWLDLNQFYLGVNSFVIEVTGTQSFEKDFLGKTPFDVYPHEMAQNIVQHHQYAIANETIVVEEESINDVTTGKIKYFTATIQPLYDTNKKLIGTIGTSIDITEKVRSEQLYIKNILQKKELTLNKIIEQEKDRLAFLSRNDSITEAVLGIAHEINQPLSAIVNYIGGCQRYFKQPLNENKSSKLLNALENISLQAHRAGKIVHTFKDLATQTESNKGYYNINKIIAKCGELSSDLLNKADITIEYYFNEDLENVQCDKTQITQVILNLINNAKDAIIANNPENRLIIIKTDMCTTERITISIEDFGCGIASEKLNDIFLPFFTTKENGMGIGLSLCYHIAQKHMGNIFVQSTIDKGSTFSFILPLKQR